MKIIFSRKGFDSSSGGCPNPILPDGELLPLPIPDTHSPVCYEDLNWPCQNGQAINLGEIAGQLSRSKVKGNTGTHLDPDLLASLCQREKGWKPLFGQSGAAQGHLQKQSVGAGDLFLFFGLFQPVLFESGRLNGKTKGVWSFDKQSPKRHVLWGWMQIEAIYDVDTLTTEQLPWARNHPHFFGDYRGNNCLYLGAEKLTLPGVEVRLPGTGCFRHFHDDLSLTSATAAKPTDWEVPLWMHPFTRTGREKRLPLSYHRKSWRWHKGRSSAKLEAAARGQEFVLDTAEYPEAVDWASSLIEQNYSY